MKIDIQGYEHRAFEHAEKLLDTIDVFYIVMEFEFYANQKGGAPPIIKDDNMVEKMIFMFLRRGYVPYDVEKHDKIALFSQKLNVTNWRNWPINVAWSKDIILGLHVVGNW